LSIPITIVGNLGREAEVKTTKTGKTFTTLSVGYTPREKRNDEWLDGETMWFRVTYWGELAPVLFPVGASVIVTGKFKQTSYDKDGVSKTSLELTADTIGLVQKPFKPIGAPAFPPADRGYVVDLDSDSTPF
jgi:single-strand DNA-binding protein